jgi:hypothetical protein
LLKKLITIKSITLCRIRKERKLNENERQKYAELTEDDLMFEEGQDDEMWENYSKTR